MAITTKDGAFLRYPEGIAVSCAENFMKIFFDYIKELQSYELTDITEHSHRPALKSLLEHIAKDAESPIHILHEPKRKSGFGAPDFKILNSKGIIGYVENKKIGENLNHILKSDQIKRYRELSDNILLTNYLEWIWIKKGEINERGMLCFLSDLADKRFKIDNDKAEKIRQLIFHFYSQAPVGIGTAKDLAKALAIRSRNLRDFLTDELDRQEREDVRGILRGLYQTFQTHIFNTLSVQEFSDAFAQMLVYGLFLARLSSGEKRITLGNAKNFIPASFELIKELVNFLEELEKTEYREVRWIIEEVLSMMNNLALAELKKDLSFSKQKAGEAFARDPYLYFYEDFLAAYDKKLRKAKGVYYTPPPVVNFIIRAVNDILKKEFGLSDGLADYKRVTVLDFAAGTGTFLLEILQQIFDSLPSESPKKELIIREHILKNLFGFEYLIAPYTIAHLKLSQFLKENGYELQNNERFQIFLTNTLEPVHEVPPNLFVPTLSKEGEEAQRIKDKPVLVICGNPPYSGHSKNNGDWIKNILKGKDIYATQKDDCHADYFSVDGKPMKEKNSKWLQDDYVKFIRFAQYKMDKVNEGIVGIITNHSFLDNPTFRGMRQSLMKTFDQLYFIDLHGNAKKKESSPDGGKDENVFDIEQGVAISLMVKRKGLKKGVFHADFWGLREQKYQNLLEKSIENIRWQEIKPEKPYYLFFFQNKNLISEYQEFYSVKDIFVINGVGITTAHDDFVTDYDKSILLDRFSSFKNCKRDVDFLHKEFNVRKKAGWDILKGWDNLQSDGNIEKYIKPISYRPFDNRYIFYEEKLVWRIVRQVMQNMIKGENIGLITDRQTNKGFYHVFCSKLIINDCTLSTATKERSYIFPLYVYELPTQIFTDENRRETSVRTENFTPEFRDFIDKKYRHKFTPEEILGYIYAILHSPTYREKYAEFLKIDFPRIPFINKIEIFRQLSAIGWNLIQKHLLNEQAISQLKTDKDYQNLGIYTGKGNNEVVSPDFKENRLHINPTQYFDNVTPEVYEFCIGGYQVLNKYLKDRKKRILSLEEIDNIENIAKILAFTIHQMECLENITLTL